MGQLTTVEAIEKKINLPAAGAMAINSQVGGVSFQSMGEVMEFAKLLAVSDTAVPDHCRGNVGICLALTVQAIEWRMSPFAVANKSYVVNDRLSYESQLIHAVVEQRAPLSCRLRCEYIGEGKARRCKIIGRLKGEEQPFEFVSEELGKLVPPKNDRGQTRGSPLWDKKPDLQLFYNASRDWARMYVPDVILGIYSIEEMEEVFDSPPPARIEQAANVSRTQRLAASVQTHKPPEDIPPRPEVPLQTGPDDDTEDQEPDEQPPEEPQSLAGTPPPEVPESLAKAATDMHRAMTPAEVAETFEYWNNKIEDPDDGMAWSDMRDWRLANLPKPKGQGSLPLN